MAEDGRVYDGHTFLFGQDTDTDASALAPNTAARAVNRVFRGGRNTTRPPFVHIPFLFELDFDLEGDARAYEDILRYGNFQGWMPYKKKKPGREDGIVVSIAGHIFFLTLVNEKWLVRFITDGNDARLLNTWFVQAEEWVYIQNGKDRPIFWNGLFPSTARRSDPALYEMPVGTIMAYIHGRVFLSNAFDQVAASDIVYGGGLTKSESTQKFTENLYWTEGGYFGMPTDLGEITGMIVVPRQDYNLNGQGELVILAENGASAIEASIPRLAWKSTRVQTMTLSGRGNVASESLITVNNDIWFRSDDGLTSYQNLRSEQKRQLSFGKVSRHVNRWFDSDTLWLQRFASAIYFNNRVLCTVSPFLGQPRTDGHGSHRYHRGIVSLDLDQASDVSGDSAFNWDGLWTGIRPCGLVKLGSRAFAFSYDSDGVNRVYEIKRSGLYDECEGHPVQTKWFYLTKRFDWRNTGRTNDFEVKKFVGGEFWVSEVRDRIQVGMDYRPDNTPCWIEALKPTDFGPDLKGDYAFSLPRAKRFKLPSPKEVCPKGGYPSTHGSQHQAMVYGQGAVRIDRLRLAMNATNDPNSPVGDCVPDDPKIAIDNACKMEDDFHYNIVEESSR